MMYFHSEKKLRNYLIALIFAIISLHIMIIRRDVFQAIADPIRRQIIDLVAFQPLNLNAIAAEFEVSRQAVSVHVKILTECGLLVITQKGRERYCEARLDQLGDVSSWIEPYKAMWESRFAALDNYLKKTKPQKKGDDKKSNKRSRRFG